MEAKTTLAVVLGKYFFLFVLENKRQTKTLFDKSHKFSDVVLSAVKINRSWQLRVFVKSSFQQNYVWNHVALSTVWIDKDRNFKLLVEKLSASAQCKTYFWVYLC